LIDRRRADTHCMSGSTCSVCGADLLTVETRTVWERAFVGPHMAYVEEKRTCTNGHTVLSLRNDASARHPA
jgi:hypothetical protein